MNGTSDSAWIAIETTAVALPTLTLVILLLTSWM